MAKVKTGVVVTNTMDKSIVVRVDRMVSHPLYGKRYRVSNKFMAHDEKNEAQIGDIVTIQEIKPMSKRKSWVLTSRIGKADMPVGPIGEEV